MKSLQETYSDLMKRADNDFPGNYRLPVRPALPRNPIIPMDRWVVAKTGPGTTIMSKTYVFSNKRDRNAFVREMLDYEEEFEHEAVIRLLENEVSVTLSTVNVGITKMDKEYAEYADLYFKQVTFASLGADGVE